MSAGEVISQIAAEATLAVEQRDREAAAFVDFVLRHTWPERAARHGAQVVFHPHLELGGPDACALPA